MLKEKRNMILLICCKMKEKGEKERKKGSNVLLGDVFPRGEQREKRKKEKEEPILKIHVIVCVGGHYVEG